MNTNYYAVIMAGGVGSRFWPVSTTAFPKQFHDMLGTGSSLLQNTYNRFTGVVPESQILVLTNSRYNDLVQEQLPKLTSKQIIGEPAMRNTAPCILVAALKIYKQNPNGIMIVAPSDHWIENKEAFSEDVLACFKKCETEDALVTLGIPPTFPNTGFGYIESKASDNAQIKKVVQFREKPDYATAKEFLQSGNFDWNAGIFIWSVKSIIKAFQNHLPEMYALFSAGEKEYNTEDETVFMEEEYGKAQNISIDYGILEPSENVFVKKANFDWNDLGTWGALYEKLEKEEKDNALVNVKPLLIDAERNMIFSEKEKVVVVDGLKDYIVVDNKDVLLIYPKNKEQEIKEVVGKVTSKYGSNYK